MGVLKTSPKFQPKFYLYFFALMCFYDSADISATFLRDAVGLELAAFHFSRRNCNSLVDISRKIWEDIGIKGGIEMTKARKIAQYLVKNDVEIEVCDMNAICKQFGAKFEEIRDVLTEEYDMAMTEAGIF